MITARAPNGLEILGLLEVVPGRANIDFTSLSGEFQYTGYTELYWDEQRSPTNEPIFIDEAGFEWKLSDLKITEE